MKRNEDEHLASISRLMPEKRVRPTALLPVWDAASFALGNLCKRLDGALIAV